MLKRKGQAQDFPMELQAEGFDQKVVKQHSEPEQGEPTVALHHQVSPTTSQQGPSDTCCKVLSHSS